ncbi:MAG: glycosyltransferase [Candidatus Aminicenantales bacterium]
MDKIRVALVHDWLTGQRGGEKVLEVLAEIFPRAPIYTLFHFKGSQSEVIEKRDIRTSFLQRLPFLKKRYRYYLPLFPLAVELFDLGDYELIISTSHCVAKGAIPPPDGLHISYIHSPVRYAWNQYFAYFSPDRLSFVSRMFVPPVIHRLRVWDESSSARVDHFVANSENVARRIRKYYRREAEVIPPPADTEFFHPPEGEPARSDYLIVSALVPYKRIDLAIAAFNLSGERLTIVGTGPDLRKLQKMARSNIVFLGPLAAPELRTLYQKAKALLLPGEEDFGITALEAQACGTPVVAYGRGGALESVIPGETGVFFSELTAAGLRGALDKFQGMKFNDSGIRANAERFSRRAFREKMAAYFERKWADHKGQP